MTTAGVDDHVGRGVQSSVVGQTQPDVGKR